MSKTYVAVQRSGQKQNELTHWKYIKREKQPNGKYRYYYIEDKNKLKVEKVEKHKYEGNFYGNKTEAYLVKSPETHSKYEIVDKSIYNDTKTGYKLYIGSQPLSKIAKEQIRIGSDFIKDTLKDLVINSKKKLGIH